jgi:hypothetical protein
MKSLILKRFFAIVTYRQEFLLRRIAMHKGGGDGETVTC